MNNVILKAVDVVKEYGVKNKVRALDGVSLEISEGDFIGIMGPSGSGKSTLLNILATIDVCTGGKVIVDGQNVKAMLEYDLSNYRKENIGFIFQEFNLIDTLTIKENIMVPLNLNYVPKEEGEKRTKEIAEKLGIEEILEKYPSECSGGQRQRAASCRALVSNPKMIVADEPTGNLDTKNSHELLSILQDLNEKEGITIVMVTHDSMIASYSKELLFIRDGKIDTHLKREGKTQKEFFYDIVDVTSKESQNLFTDMGK